VRAARRTEGEWLLQWDAQPPARELGPALGAAIRAYTAEAVLPTSHGDLALLAPAQPEELLFFDLETLGFGNAGVFLIGWLTLSEDEVHVEQAFAEDYSQEHSIIRLFAERLARGRVLVSFNGKSFDFPLLTGRAGMWQVELPSAGELDHVDVLYECRRRWSQVLPDCRLETLERFVCRRRRTADVPGSEIPRVYHDFVETGDARLVEPVLRHNVLDLVTLAEILLKCIE
jgi:uncharacterized protein YprB with RNaseH-like and TPR domain